MNHSAEHFDNYDLALPRIQALEDDHYRMAHRWIYKDGSGDMFLVSEWHWHTIEISWGAK